MAADPGWLNNASLTDCSTCANSACMVRDESKQAKPTTMSLADPMSTTAMSWAMKSQAYGYAPGIPAKWPYPVCAQWLQTNMLYSFRAYMRDPWLLNLLVGCALLSKLY